MQFANIQASRVRKWLIAMLKNKNSILPDASKESPHCFGLYDESGKKLTTAYFPSYKIAVQRAKEEYAGKIFTVEDLDNKWLIETAGRYRVRIKQLHKSFKSAMLIMDMTNLYYSRTPENWYTVIPFTYKGKRYVYRENVKEDWIECTV